MAKYALYCTTVSNYNRMIYKDADGKEFSENTAREYAKGITGCSVFLIKYTKRELLHA